MIFLFTGKFAPGCYALAVSETLSEDMQVNVLDRLYNKGSMFHIVCSHFLLFFHLYSHYAKKSEFSTFRQNAFEALFINCLHVDFSFKKPVCVNPWRLSTEVV